MATSFVLGSMSVSEFQSRIVPVLERVLADPHSKVYTNDRCNLLLRHLAAQDYRNVTIYHTGPQPKQNPGKWKTVGNFSSDLEVDEILRSLPVSSIILDRL